MNSPAENPSRHDELIALAVEGDKSAIGELLYSISDEVARFIGYRLPKSIQSAISVEDVLQETFAVAFRDIGQFESRGPGSFLAWVRTLAMHRIQDNVRAQQRKKRGGEFRRVSANKSDPNESVVELFDILVGDENTPLRKASRQEAVQLMNVALAELSEEYREAVRLQYVEGLSYEEIGQRMDKSVGSVQGLIKRAKQKLRDALGRASAYLSSR